VSPYYADDWLTVYQGDCRAVMASMEPESVHCVVTSPPYWGLRDYGNDGQLGLEPTPEAYVANMAAVFREVRRVLRDDGTVWLNLGDSYASGTVGRNDEDEANLRRRFEQYGTGRPKAGRGLNAGRTRPVVSGLKPKDLVGIPWRVAFALQADGWYLRSDIIWSKPNPMPESVTDRPTKSHEYLFLLSKSARYYFDADAVREAADPQYAARYAKPFFAGVKEQSGQGRSDGASNTAGVKPFSGERNIRSVWTIATQPYPGAHFATFPPKLVEPCVKAGCPSGGVVLDPFGGSGTTGMVAQSLGRRAVLIDLNGDYLVQAMRRNQQSPLGLDVA
jgi:DNA modification methylase